MKDIETGHRLVDMKLNQVGIYALHLRGEIVYIGQASCIRTRLQTHVYEKRKNFDSYSFICLNPILEKLNYVYGRAYLDWVEAYEITRLMPVENRHIPNISLMEVTMPQGLVAFCKRVLAGEGEIYDDITFAKAMPLNEILPPIELAA